MINWKSIISQYNDKPTLLEWLKLVKKALDESVLENVSVNNVDETTITLSFNFADGTKITTPSITLPRGLTGATGATGATGEPGKDGVSVTGFDTVSDEVVGNETLTTVRAHFSDGNTDEFVVTATNGNAMIYKHILLCGLYDSDNIKYNIIVYSSKSDAMTVDYVLANEKSLVGAISTVLDNNGTVTFDRVISGVVEGPPGGYFGIYSGGAEPAAVYINIESDNYNPI